MCVKIKKNKIKCQDILHIKHQGIKRVISYCKQNTLLKGALGYQLVFVNTTNKIVHFLVYPKIKLKVRSSKVKFKFKNPVSQCFSYLTTSVHLCTKFQISLCRRYNWRIVICHQFPLYYQKKYLKDISNNDLQNALTK